MTPITLYAHQNSQGLFCYVGATTNLAKRWPGVPCVVLEETTLGRQVEREAYWIQKLREEGHPLRNRVRPSRIRLRPPPYKGYPIPHYVVQHPDSKESHEYRARAHRRHLIDNAEWYRENGGASKVDAALAHAIEDQRYWAV